MTVYPPRGMTPVRQPGAANPRRVESVSGRGRPLAFTLQPGLTFMEAVAAPFIAAGYKAGAVEIEGGALGPFHYLMPGLSKDGKHAAWYSDTYKPAGVTKLKTGRVTFGERDGQPFLHCHAVWIEADGRARGGHILPHETIVAAPIAATGIGSANAAIVARFDDETHFKIFGPVPESAPSPEDHSSPKVIFARLRPGVDVCEGVIAICREHGVQRARLRGGVGSIVEPIFEDGSWVRSIATEVFFERGAVVLPADGDDEAVIDVGLVDIHGDIHRGRLVPGQNPVCITFEICIEAM